MILTLTNNFTIPKTQNNPLHAKVSVKALPSPADALSLSFVNLAKALPAHKADIFFGNNDNPPIKIYNVHTTDSEEELAMVGRLFRSYFKECSQLGLNLDYQHLSLEINDLMHGKKPPKFRRKSEKAEKGGRLYLAVADYPLGPVPLGCAAYRVLNEDKNTCELKRCYTIPSARGQGLAPAMVGRAIIEAKRAGYEEMYLDTYAILGDAVKLYTKKFGFKVVGLSGTTPARMGLSNDEIEYPLRSAIDVAKEVGIKYPKPEKLPEKATRFLWKLSHWGVNSSILANNKYTPKADGYIDKQVLPKLLEKSQRRQSASYAEKHGYIVMKLDLKKYVPNPLTNLFGYQFLAEDLEASGN